MVVVGTPNNASTTSSRKDDSSAEESTIWADPNLHEEMMMHPQVTLVILPNHRQTLQFQQSGILSPKLANEALQVCRTGCRTMHQFIRQHLLEKTTEGGVTE